MSWIPLSAAATGQVDEVLAVEAMPAKLIAYAQHLTLVGPSKDGDGTAKDAASSLLTIMAALRARSGHDFSEYKDKTLLRRLQAEAAASGRSDFRFLSANSGFEKQAGIGNVAGKGFREVFADEADGWLDIFDKIMASGEPLRFERELIGRKRTLELFAFRFVEDDAQRLGVIFLDVTSRKRHEEQQELLLREMDHRGVVGAEAQRRRDGIRLAAGRACLSPVRRRRTLVALTV